jgi:RimJ/RimL family protein N-acetyltransferase
MSSQTSYDSSDDCHPSSATAPGSGRGERLSLSGGRSILIRPLHCGDRAGLAGLFERMSWESRLRRFFTPKIRLTDRELTFFTQIDHVTHEALAAIDEDDGAIIGVARYVRYADRRGVADVSVEVADDHQSIGVGTALAVRLVERGRANGLDRLSATTRWENRAARALAQRVGLRAHWSRGGEIVLEMAVGPERPAPAA